MISGGHDLDPVDEDVQRLTRLWWLAVTLGVLSLVVGVIVIVKPSNSLKTLAVIVGIFVLLDGIAEFILAFDRRTANRGLVALLGLLDLVVGILLIRHPVTGVKAIALLLAIWLIAAGVVRLMIAFDTRGDRLGRFVVAAIEIVFGIVIVANPNIGFATLAVLVGLAFIFNGIGVIAFGLLLRAVKNQPRPHGLAAAS
ncbi:MAG TPA: HdeD family acid-resistance protein [Solirubrobacteraceae bacterium]|nr:HdeD family acid-resistance protein [Solirubrobacteraceae bacterium]